MNNSTERTNQLALLRKTAPWWLHNADMVLAYNNHTSVAERSWLLAVAKRRTNRPWRGVLVSCY